MAHGMSEAEFNELWPLYERDIQGVARKLARSDDDLWDDLVSVGMVTFWRLNLASVVTNRDAFVTSSVRKRMIDFLRKERRYTTESLNALLSNGFQLTQDDETGEVIVMEPKHRRGVAYEDPEYNLNKSYHDDDR